MKSRAEFLVIMMIPFFSSKLFSTDAILYKIHFVYTVKTLGLFQPHFGHLSCMPVVYVTRYMLETSKDDSNLIQSVVEKLLYFGFSCRRPINQHFW